MQKHIILKVIRKDFVNLHGYKIETNQSNPPKQVYELILYFLLLVIAWLFCHILGGNMQIIAVSARIQ